MAEKMTVHACVKCKSKLFFNWGMELMLTPATYKTNARGEPSKFADSVTNKWVNACAKCKTPYYMDEGELVDASDLVSAEEVVAALNAIRDMPVGGKAKNIDP